MNFKGLRIAISLTCIVGCLLLGFFWIRSYFRWDSPYLLTGRWEIQINSLLGYLYVGLSHQPREFPPQRQWRVYRGSRFTEDGADSETVVWSFSSQTGALGFGTATVGNYRFIYVPYWFLIFILGLLAALNRTAIRFSLRTLLIAMTLLAALFGLLHAAGHTIGISE